MNNNIHFTFDFIWYPNNNYILYDNKKIIFINKINKSSKKENSDYEVINITALHNNNDKTDIYIKILQKIILPKTFGIKHLLIPVHRFRLCNRVLTLSSNEITILELLNKLYIFYNTSITHEELETINNNDCFNYVNDAKKLKNPVYSDIVYNLLPSVITKIYDDFYLLHFDS